MPAQTPREETMRWLESHLPAVLDRANLTDAEHIACGITELIAVDGSERDTACEAVCRLLNAGIISSARALAIVKMALLFTSGLSASSRSSLMDVLVLLVADSSSGLSRRQAGEMVSRCLDTEIQVGGLVRNDALIGDAISKLTALCYLPALPTLDALRNNYPTESVRIKAEEAFLSLKGGVRPLWQATPADLLTASDARARLLERDLDDDALTATEKIQSLFCCVKETSIAPGDPRLPAIDRLMKAAFERLRLAAAYALVETAETSSTQYRSAIETLAGIAVNGVEAACVAEACAILDGIKENHPELVMTIANATERANIAFLERFR